MKRKQIKSSLFSSELLGEQQDNIQGGGRAWTSKHDDSAMNTGNYDIFFNTSDKEGDNKVMDTYDTGATTKDRPVG